MSLEVQPKGYQGQLEGSLGQKKGSEGKPEGSEGELEGSDLSTMEPVREPPSKLG